MLTILAVFVTFLIMDVCGVIETTNFYIINDQSKNQADAQQYCRDTYGTGLARIWNSIQNDNLGNEVIENNIPRIWIDGKDIGENNDYYYSDGELFWSGLAGSGSAQNDLYTNFEPNAPNGNEYCVEMFGVAISETNKRGSWNDLSCDVAQNFACDKQPFYLISASITPNKAFNEARAYCRETFGTDLAILDSVDKSDKAEELIVLRNAGGTRPFFGATDQLEENKWEWVNGVNFWNGRADGSRVNNSWAHWYNGEPNNYDSGENCAELRTDGTWNDVPCGRLQNFLCSKVARITGVQYTPTISPTNGPSKSPTDSPTLNPSKSPTKAPTQNPSVSPSDEPTQNPSVSPTNAPTILTNSPTIGWASDDILSFTLEFDLITTRTDVTNYQEILIESLILSLEELSETYYEPLHFRFEVLSFSNNEIRVEISTISEVCNQQLFELSQSKEFIVRLQNEYRNTLNDIIFMFESMTASQAQ